VRARGLQGRVMYINIYIYILIHIYILIMYTIGGSERAAGGRRRRRYSVYLLYWYKSTNTDAAASHLPPLQSKLLKASTCNRYSVYLL
jgi:hypothetical protein